MAGYREDNTLPWIPPGSDLGLDIVGPPDPPVDPVDPVVTDPNDPAYVNPSLQDTLNQPGQSDAATRAYNARYGTAYGTNREVQQEELSQWQLEQMLGSDSPLMRQRAEAGLAAAGSRGLMNSSVGIGASQGAMIAGAQPFALQDADRYGQTASENMAATNAASLKNAALMTEAEIAAQREQAARDRTIIQGDYDAYADVRENIYDVESREDTQEFTRDERLAGEEFLWMSAEQHQGFTELNQDDQQRFLQLQQDDQQKFMAWSQNDQQDFLNMQQDDQQDFLTWQQNDQQEFLSWQQDDQQEFLTWKQVDQQAFLKQEREMTQDWQSYENATQRDWQSQENISAADLQWAMANLDSATRLGMTRDQIFADMYGAIMMNDNPKFTAIQRDAAVSKLINMLDDRFGTEQGAGGYEGSYVNDGPGEWDFSGSTRTWVENPDFNPENWQQNPDTGEWERIGGGPDADLRPAQFDPYERRQSRMDGWVPYSELYPSGTNDLPDP